LLRIEWQQSANNIGEKRTSTFLQEMYEVVRNDTQKKLQPAFKKGVSCSMHYKSLAPENFILPLLHIEIGMVNQVWEVMEGWIDDEVEVVPEDEKAARKSLLDAKENIYEAT
jgi:hypothetical protein